MLDINKVSDQITVVNFNEGINKLNVIIADKLKQELNKLFDNGYRNVILDFSGIIFVDSSGFGALVTIFNHAKNAGSNLILSGVSKGTMELIKVTKLDQVFEIYDNVELAKESII